MFLENFVDDWSRIKIGLNFNNGKTIGQKSGDVTKVNE
ncbi:hypothetical protein C943_01701 [Mariniradius saccharolyticus AK6]|uniref:Uncharacterized protein n=1 Tax=Mariniradius saccharolyticus AK6 TaxID=1239962 RepID=M7Y3Y3_9BACT|nr:hypothetical protein C943_01701 [Mariniradius saccharolyticus AK6]